MLGAYGPIQGVSMIRPALVAVILAALLPAAHAQDDPHAACAGSIGWVPREVLERPLPIRPGVGTAHDPVTTSVPEAQAFYDQGVAYLHSYVWIEAARSFHEALRRDPKLALAWIGLSRVFTALEDAPAAHDALEKAQALASAVSPREKRRIALRATHLEALDDLGDSAKHLAYKKALDQALAADMNDAELWMLRGNAEEASAAGRGQRGGAASIAFYERALAVVPGHFAAHHYLIHSYETIGLVPEALAHGEVYVRAAPAIPHAHHMWAHDLRRVGRTQDAIAEFKKADELEEAYYVAEKIPADLDWHHKHNLDLLSTSFQHQGQMKEAERLMRRAYALNAPLEYMDYQKKEWPGFLLARGRVEEAEAAGIEFSRSRYPATRVAGHVVLGDVHLARGRVEEAQKELALAEKEAESMPKGPRALSPDVAPYVDRLRGEVYLRSGRTEEGRALLKEVQTRIRAIPGPDAWMQALFVLESIANSAREAGDWDLAEYTARQMQDHDPSYAGAHFMLALVADHRGDAAAARASFAEAEKLWSHADSDLPELSRARSRVAEAR
jgi:tetratricopeptide (TPR) repeat protein